MMTTLLAGLALQDPAAGERCCAKSGIAPWKGYESGLKWVVPVGQARRRAQEQKKPLLLVLLAGDLDKEGT
jgi:hypothetical protein